MYLEETKNYWSTRSEGYSESILRDYSGDAHRLWLDLLQKYKPEGEDLKILDAGCGPGYFPIVLSNMGHTVTAIDYTPQMLEQAKKNVDKFGVSEKVSYLRADIQNLPFEDNSFDLVISRNVVWTIEAPDKAYREWLRVLKPGGVFLNFDSNFLFSLYDDNLIKQYKENEKEAIALGYVPVPNDHLKDGMDAVLPNLPFATSSRPEWDMNFLAGLPNCEQLVLDKGAYKGLLSGYHDVLERTCRMFLIKGVKAK